MTYQARAVQYNKQVAHCVVYKRGKLHCVWGFQFLINAEVARDQVEALGPFDELPTYGKIYHQGLERPYSEDF